MGMSSRVTICGVHTLAHTEVTGAGKCTGRLAGRQVGCYTWWLTAVEKVLLQACRWHEKDAAMRMHLSAKQGGSSSNTNIIRECWDLVVVD